MFQKETFSEKGENFGANSHSVSVFSCHFYSLIMCFLVGKNFHVWNLIKFKKQNIIKVPWLILFL